MPRPLFGMHEDLDTSHRNTSTVVRAVEGCTHARTIDDCNPKTWRCQGYVITAVLLFLWAVLRDATAFN